MVPNFIIHHNTVINLNNVTCIYIKPLCEKNPETHQRDCIAMTLSVRAVVDR